MLDGAGDPPPCHVPSSAASTRAREVDILAQLGCLPPFPEAPDPMLRTPVARSLATLVALVSGTLPMHLGAQSQASDCVAPPDSTRASAPSIALDLDPAAHFLVGDSVRIALALNNAPSGGRVSFVATGIDRATIDAGNVLRWRPTRGMEGPNYVTVSARLGSAILACRQVRLTVDRAQRAPIVRIASKQVQAGGQLDFMVGAVDPDGDSLSYLVTDMTSGAPAASIDSTGRFRWRAPGSVNASGTPYQFKVEVSDGVSISAAVFAVMVSGQNARPECPLTILSITSSEGSDVLLPMAATDPNGDALRYRPERELTNGRVDSLGYRWEIPWGTVDNGASERSLDFQWRAIDTQNAQSDLCTTRITVRSRMEPERLRIEQAAHARFFASAELTAQELDTRLDEIRSEINASDHSRRRRSIIALGTALLAGAFQLAKSDDTRRIAGGINTLTSVFFAGFNALATGTDGLKSDARKYEDQLTKYSQMVVAFRVSYGDTVTEQVLRSPQYKADRAALEAEQGRATALMR